MCESTFLPSDWIFDEHIADIFDTHIRQSTPFYDEIQRMIVELANGFIVDDAVICDLGTATGEVIYNLNVKNPSRNLTFYGIDNSVPMLKKAKFRCDEFRNVTFINEDINNFILPKSNLITSVYTLQFINKNNRQDVINKIYNSLEKDGAFILCEKIIFDDEFIADYYVKLHHGLKKRNKISDAEIIAKKASLINIMHPITYKENEHMLKMGGFSTIEPFFQWYNFIGIIAVKD